MLDMGFQEDVEAILRQLPSERQTAFFSATFPPAIAYLSRTWQKRAVRVTPTPTEQSRPAIRQVAHRIDRDERLEALILVLRAHPPGSMLVFCNFKASVRDVAAALKREGMAAAELHGDLDQQQRDREMARFRNGTTRILVATDVAARGLDIAGLDAVVNYEFPTVADTYVHRIGRTGRAGAPGLAISLVTPVDTDRLAQAEAVVGAPIERVPVPTRQQAPVASQAPTVQMETLFVSGGRTDKLRATDILGALTGEAGLAGTDIGRIEIHDRFTFVAVPQKVATALLKKSGSLRIKGRTFRVERVE